MHKFIIPFFLSISLFFITNNSVSANSNYVDTLVDEGWKYVYKIGDSYVGVNYPLAVSTSSSYLQVVGGEAGESLVIITSDGNRLVRYMYASGDDTVFTITHNYKQGDTITPVFPVPPAIILPSAEEIPQVMTKTMVDGGVLSTGLIVLAILLGISLVRRFPLWRLR